MVLLRECGRVLCVYLEEWECWEWNVCRSLLRVHWQRMWSQRRRVRLQGATVQRCSQHVACNSFCRRRFICSHRQCVQMIQRVHACVFVKAQIDSLQGESKKVAPWGFSGIFFQNGWEFSVQILHAYYTFLSTLDYKIASGRHRRYVLGSKFEPL